MRGKPKILIAVGGSGGHVYPAQAVAEGLLARDKEIEILFVGGGLSANRFFDRHLFPFREIPCGVFDSANPLKVLRAASRITQGFTQSRKLLRSFQPDLVVGFGSYHSLPPLMAAKYAAVPMLLHEANAVPGKINRLLSRYAHTVGISFPDAAEAMDGNIVEVEMPLRAGYCSGSISQREARESLGLHPHLLTILVFGGSQGALAVNRLFADAAILCRQMKMPRFQLLHLTGYQDETSRIAELYRQHSLRAVVKDFEPRMDMAWAAADLVVGRAGASTIAEQIAFEVPGVLIPYPYAGHHQDKNADFMTLNVRGAFKYQQDQLNAEKLADVLSKICDRDLALLKEMKQAIQQYKRHVERPDFVSVILEILGGKQGS